MGQDYWQDDKTGIWCNENDGGETIYWAEHGSTNAVVVMYADRDGDGLGDGGGITTDEGEMKKAMEAAADGHTYVPEGEDRKKWSRLPEQKEGEGKWSWLKRALGFGKKENKSDGIMEGCDPKKMEDWLNGRMPGWGSAIMIENGKAPVRLKDPSGTARTIARSL